MSAPINDVLLRLSSKFAGIMVIIIPTVTTTINAAFCFLLQSDMFREVWPAEPRNIARTVLVPDLARMH